MARHIQKRRATKTPKEKQTRKRSSGRLSLVSDEQIIREYNKLLPNCRALAEETKFILSKLVDDSGIRISDISTRVKELDSTIKKIKDKEYDGINHVGDLVGTRLVCLFRSDLDAFKRLIEENFQVDEFDDKS